MENITYEEFIQNILNTRGRFSCGDEYHERHHIVPRCMNGGDNEENLVDLFAREHFIAHKLLAQENPDNDKLIYAWWMMAFMKNDKHQRCEISPEEYESVRIAFSQMMKEKFCGENNPMYGKHHTEEIRQLIKIAATNISEETREKMRESAKNRCDEEWRENASKIRSGKQRTQHRKSCSSETKELISKANSKEVMQLTLNDELIRIFYSGREASRITGVDPATIWLCCNGRYKTGGGYKWQYVDQNNKPHKNRMRTVIQLDYDNNIIKEWECAAYAEKELNIPSNKITSCCRGIYRSTGGFKWMYKDEYEKLTTEQNDCTEETNI